MAKTILLGFLMCFLVTGIGHAQIENDITPETPTLVKRNLSTTNHIELYPNPVSDHLNISIDNSTFEKVEFEVYNIIGNSLNILVEETGKNKYRINLKELNSGYYLLIVKDPVKRINKSFKFQKI